MLLTSYHSTQTQIRKLKKTRRVLHGATIVLWGAAAVNFAHGHTINLIAGGLCVAVTITNLVLVARITQQISVVEQHQRTIKRLMSNGSR